MRKRSKKQNEGTRGQLCLFELPGIRQEEESRTRPKKRPAAALKPAAPIFIPPAPIEAPKRPENAPKTKILDRQALNQLWKANPVALHTLNRMKEINPYIITLVQAFDLVPYKENVKR